MGMFVVFDGKEYHGVVIFYGKEYHGHVCEV